MPKCGLSGQYYDWNREEWPSPSDPGLGAGCRNWWDFGSPLLGRWVHFHLYEKCCLFLHWSSNSQTLLHVIITWGILLKCIFCFSKSGVGSQILHSPFPRWCSCCWSMDHLFNRKARYYCCCYCLKWQSAGTDGYLTSLPYPLYILLAFHILNTPLP